MLPSFSQFIVYISIFFCSCGTLFNVSSPSCEGSNYNDSSAVAYYLDGPVDYYGGVKRDVNLLPTYLFLLPGIIDLPLSLAFDTLTLPIVAWRRKNLCAEKTTFHLVGIVKNNQKRFTIAMPENINLKTVSIKYQLNKIQKTDTYQNYDAKNYIRPYQDQFEQGSCCYSDNHSIQCQLDYQKRQLIFTFFFDLDEDSNVFISYSKD